MEFFDFVDLFFRMKEQEFAHKIWEIWLVAYPNMDEDNYISYEDMLAKQNNIRNEPKQEVPGNGAYVDQIFI